MARRNTVSKKVTPEMDGVLNEQTKKLNLELRPKLMKPLKQTDTQRIHGILYGTHIYDALFNKKKGKKGSVFDILFIFFWMFFAAAALLVVMIVWNNLYDGLSFESTTGTTVMNIFEDQIKPQYDFMILGMYMGAFIITIILAYLQRMHRIFIAIAFIFTVATFIVSAVFANVWEELVADGQMSTAAASFPVTDFVISYFPIFYILLSFLVIFVMAISERT